MLLHLFDKLFPVRVKACERMEIGLAQKLYATCFCKLLECFQKILTEGLTLLQKNPGYAERKLCLFLFSLKLVYRFQQYHV